MRTSRSPHELVAEEIRAEMARQRVSQAAVAVALQVSQAGASRRLNGQTPVDVNDLYHLADLLRVPVGRLLPDLTEKASA